MKKEIESLGRQTVIYGAGSMMTRLGAFLLLPLYTNYLSPAEFGTLELFYMTTAMISIFLGTQFSHATLRFYFEYDSEAERNRVISSSFILYFSFCAIVLSMCALFSRQFSQWIFSTALYAKHFAVLFAWLLISLSNEILYAYIRALERAYLFIIVTLVELVIKLSFCILFVAVWKWSVFGVLVGNLIGTVVPFLFFGIFTCRRCSLDIDVPLFFRLIRYTLPLIFVSICGTVMGLADRFLLKTYTSLTAVGLYALGMRFANATNFLIFHPFTKGYGPFRFSIMHKENAKSIYARVMTYFCFFFLWASLAATAFSREIIQVMANKSYWNAYEVIPILLVSVFWGGMYYMFQIGVYLKKNTRVLTFVFAGAALFNIVTLWLLIPPYGIMGAAISVCATRMLVAFLSLYCSQLVYPVQYEWLRCFKVAAVFTVLAILSSLPYHESPYLSAAMKLPVLFIYPLLLYAVGFYKPEEIGFITKILSRMITAWEMKRDVP